MRHTPLFAALAFALVTLAAEARADEPSRAAPLPPAPPPVELAASWPEELDYARDRPVPPGYVVARRRRTPLLVAGTVTAGLGVATVTTGIVLAEATQSSQSGCHAHLCSSDGELAGLVLAMAGGAAFVTGGVLALVGLSSKKVYRRADLAAPAPSLTVVPFAGSARSGGLAAYGAF